MKGACLLVLLSAFATVSQAGDPCSNNPCQAGLREDLKKDAVCHVTPGAPGGYTCTCGDYQKPTWGPNPSTCVLCPSAEPCIFVRDCPPGSSCSSSCGDQRGVHCQTPGGQVVPRGGPPVPSPCSNNPCQAGLREDLKKDAVCHVTPGAPGGYTCTCGDYQKPTWGPNPSTCVLCPSAEPCALVHDCPPGSSCSSACGDQRGVHCQTPGGQVVPRGGPPVPSPCADNPCQAGLREDLKKDAVCHVTPGAPGGYTCTCGDYQKPTFGPNPSTCVLCPSAEPCIFKQDCPQGTSCSSTCGDQRGVRCAKDACDGNPCGPAGVCTPKYTAPYPYTCNCQNGFVSNYGTCVPSKPADVI